LSRLLLAAASLLVLAFAPAQYLGRQQDDLIYLLAAQALPTGRYELWTAVGHPPLTSTAPGWPLLLAPLSLFTDSPGAFQAFAALVLAACPWAIWYWLKRRTTETNALLVALLFAASPLALSQSGVLMPEPPYLLVLLAILIATERGRKTAAGWLGALLVLVRPAGLSAVPALIAEPAFAGRWKDAARAALPALAAAALWSAWSLRVSGEVQEASELALAYGGGGHSPLAIAFENAAFFCASFGGQFLPPRLADGPLAALLGLVLVAAAGFGAVLAVGKRKGDPAAWVLLGALGMHAFWTWRYERYLIPLLPFLLWALVESLGERAPRVLAALLAAQLGFQVLPRLGRPSPWGEPELSATYAWLRERSEPGALASAVPVRDGWHSRRPCVALPDEDSSAGFAKRLKEVRAAFIVRQDGLDFGLSEGKDAPVQKILDRAYGHLDDKRRFRLVHHEVGERARVYAPL
jgi:hypothetical protein